MWRHPAGGDGQVYDVDHIAGLCGDEVRVRACVLVRTYYTKNCTTGSRACVRTCQKRFACVLVRRGSRPGVTKDFLGHFFG